MDKFKLLDKLMNQADSDDILYEIIKSLSEEEAMEILEDTAYNMCLDEDDEDEDEYY